METSRSPSCFCALLLLCAAMCIVAPAIAADTITIAYRGSGGGYIGDTIIFDGLNTAGNTTVIKITGPNLPAEGVPLYNLDGTPGSGNTVLVDSRNLWVYSWDSSRIDTSKLRTGRYTFTAWDEENPDVTATTSLMLKKPEFTLTATPATARIGDYIELEGMAETGVSYIKLDITDPAGTVIRTFIAPVSGAGFFQHGFHVDMQPGQYTVTGSNPSMKKNLGVVFTITAPAETVTTVPPVETTGEPATTPTDTGTRTGAATPASTQAGSITGAFAIMLVGIGSAALLFRRK